MSLLVRAARMLNQQREVIKQKNALIETAQERIALERADKQEMRLLYARNTRDLLEHFLRVLERPEDEEDALEALRAGLQDLRDEVARQEEYVSTSRFT